MVWNCIQLLSLGARHRVALHTDPANEKHTRTLGDIYVLRKLNYLVIRIDDVRTMSFCATKHSRYGCVECCALVGTSSIGNQYAASVFRAFMIYTDIHSR